MPIQRIEGFGNAGWITDLSPASLPPGAWTECKHTIPHDGKAVRAWDTDPVFDLDIEPRFRFSFRDPSNRQFLIVGNGTQVFAYNIGTGVGEEITGEEITPYDAVPTPVFSDQCSFCAHNGVLCYSTFNHGIFYWPGPGNQLIVFPSVDPGDGSNIGWRYDRSWRCTALASFKYYLIALGMSEDGEFYQHKIRWSASAPDGAVPTEWTATTENDSGDDVLGETAGPILGAQQVQDALWIIKQDGVYSLNYVGGNEVLGNRRLAGELDVSSRDATQEYLGRLVVLSGRDLYSYDGAIMRSLVDQKVRDALNESMAGRYDRGKIFVDQFVENLWVLGGPTGDGRHTEALVLDLTTGAWGHQYLNNAYALVSLAERGTSLGVYALESNVANTSWFASKLTREPTTSQSFISRIARSGIPFEGSPGRAMITEVWPEIQGSGDFQISVRGQETLSGAMVEDGPYVFSAPGDYHLTPRVSGRFLGYALESNSTTGWEVDNLTFRYEVSGEH
ncbi:virion structural protein [Thiohalocapsa phage LS06-2018-MD04]|nr:virion structural protein [Thiohalocapsa phage LS06-2018-MD04]